MKINKFTLMVLLALVSFSCQTTYLSTIKSDSIEIDGDRSEWEYGLFVDNVNKLVFGIQNDSEYLYLMFASRNKSLSRAALMGGLQCAFSIDNDDLYTIVYPTTKGKIEKRITDSQPILRFPEEFQMIDAEENQKLVLFKTFEKQGGKIALSDNEEELVYELQIPISNKPFGLAIADFSNTINIELSNGKFEFSGPEGGGMPGNGEGPGGRGGPGGGSGGFSGGGKGGGGMPGGGNAGGPGGGPNRGGNVQGGNSPKNFNLKFDIELANQ